MPEVVKLPGKPIGTEDCGKVGGDENSIEDSADEDLSEVGSDP